MRPTRRAWWPARRPSAGRSGRWPASMPNPSFLKTAASYCAKLTQKSQSNFYYAFLFLPRERREALEAVYAYCRLVDDVVDEEATVAAKLAGIERWRHELELVYGQGEVTHPVS